MKQIHALAALIDEVRTANGWSDPDVVARAAKKGHKLSKSNISRIRNNPVVTLNIETVSALADGLGISKSMVANAALASMGIISYNSADLTAEEAIRRDPTLSARDKRTLLAVLGGLRNEPADLGQERGGNADSTAPINQAIEPAATPDTLGSDKRTVATSTVPATPNDTGRTAKRHTAAPDSDKRDATVHQLRADTFLESDIPLPENWRELAAHPKTDSAGMREHAAGMERGEESQDFGDE